MELMYHECGCGQRCMVSPRSDAGCAALFIIMHRGGYAGGRKEDAFVLLPLKLELVVLDGVD
jgi:hypothetical protein